MRETVRDIIVILVLPFFQTVFQLGLFIWSLAQGIDGSNWWFLATALFFFCFYVDAVGAQIALKQHDLPTPNTTK